MSINQSIIVRFAGFRDGFVGLTSEVISANLASASSAFEDDRPFSSDAAARQDSSSETFAFSADDSASRPALSDSAAVSLAVSESMSLRRLSSYGKSRKRKCEQGLLKFVQEGIVAYFGLLARRGRDSLLSCRLVSRKLIVKLSILLRMLVDFSDGSVNLQTAVNMLPRV